MPFGMPPNGKFSAGFNRWPSSETAQRLKPFSLQAIKRHR
jgi:hypothetical protein